MQTTVIVASIAAIISIISCVLSVKNYNKSKRLEFFQRRDQLLLKVSNLNARNSENRLISARYEIVSINRLSLVLDGKHKEENTTLIASIKNTTANIGLAANHWDEIITDLHFICSNFTLTTDAARIEKLIDLVQVASDEVTKSNEVYLASLHTLETTYPILRDSLATRHKSEITKGELDLEDAIRDIKRNAKASD
jgi:hypothetical protein